LEKHLKSFLLILKILVFQKLILKLLNGIFEDQKNDILVGWRNLAVKS